MTKDVRAAGLQSFKQVILSFGTGTIVDDLKQGGPRQWEMDWLYENNAESCPVILPRPSS